MESFSSCISHVLPWLVCASITQSPPSMDMPHNWLLPLKPHSLTPRSWQLQCCISPHQARVPSCQVDTSCCWPQTSRFPVYHWSQCRGSSWSLVSSSHTLGGQWPREDMGEAGWRCGHQQGEGDSWAAGQRHWSTTSRWAVVQYMYWIVSTEYIIHCTCCPQH